MDASEEISKHDTGLTSLPNELITKIFESITTGCDSAQPRPSSWDNLDRVSRRTLLNLCEVSRSIRENAQPVLHRTFVVEAYSPGRPRLCFHVCPSYPGFTCSSHLHNPRLLVLRTLLDRPDLAGCLKTINIGAWDMESWFLRREASGRTGKVSTKNKINIIRVLLQMRTTGDLKPLLRSGDEDGAAALLLLIAGQSIQELSFTLSTRLARGPPDSIFLDVLSAAVDPTSTGIPRFSNLRSVTIDLSPRSYIKGTNDRLGRLADIFRLPALKSFNLHSWRAYTDLPPFDVPAGSSTVEELCFRDCVAANDVCLPTLHRVLRSIVTCCSDLRVCRYSTTVRLNDASRDMQMTTGEFLHGLFSTRLSSVPAVFLELPDLTDARRFSFPPQITNA